jgi:large subunit ribosomal protein L21
MYAVVELGGKQFRVSEKDTLIVPTMDAQVGDKVTVDRVLLVDKNGKVTVGTPHVEGASVEVKVLDHVKGEKLTVFKKRRRKGYRVSRGHRQGYTQVSVEKVKMASSRSKKK